MATFDEHCADCMAELGQTYSEVHKFLDSYYGELGYSHRMVLHHSLGIEIVRRFFWRERCARSRDSYTQRLPGRDTRAGGLSKRRRDNKNENVENEGQAKSNRRRRMALRVVININKRKSSKCVGTDWSCSCLLCPFPYVEQTSLAQTPSHNPVSCPSSCNPL